jgi:hypothetical protein
MVVVQMVVMVGLVAVAQTTVATPEVLEQVFLVKEIMVLLPLETLAVVAVVETLLAVGSLVVLVLLLQFLVRL